MAVRFPLGRLVATPGALEALQESEETALPFLRRHAQGDWGEVCKDDGRANDRALREGERLLSAYRTAQGTRLWVIHYEGNGGQAQRLFATSRGIAAAQGASLRPLQVIAATEADRSSTCILLPEEY